MVFPVAAVAAVVNTALAVHSTVSGINRNKANAKLEKEQVELNNQLLSRQYEAQKEVVEDMTSEYSSIVSYKSDMLRQEQLHKRQIIGYHLLKSGLAITPNDSAGLLLRLQANHDEMEARAQEIEYFHNRPRMKMDKQGLDISIKAGKQRIQGIQSALPWQNTMSFAQGGMNLMTVYEKYQGMKDIENHRAEQLRKQGK